jgi:phage-related protein (TIGR01555 family)
MIFWPGKKKPVDAEPVSVIERVEPRGSLFTTHAQDGGFNNNARSQAVHDVMMRIRAQAIHAMPRFDARMPDGAVMDGFDGLDGLDGDGGFAFPNMSEGVLMWYAQQSFVPSQMCAIVAQNWLVNKACSIMPRDAIRKGYKVIGDDGNELDPRRAKLVERYDQAYGLKKNLRQFIRKGKIFGIRIAIFKVRSADPYYYEKPFNIDGVGPGTYQGIVQPDPYWCAPLLDRAASSDPLSLRFYEPTYWQINGRKIHHSHLVVYINDEVMDFLKPSYIYGGVSLPQQIMERIYAAERTANEGPMLAMTKRSTILKTDAAKVLANKQKFDETMQWWIYNRDNYQVRVIDKEDEDIEQIDTTLADLDKVTMNQYQLVSAVARTPATRLLGTVPTGFNSTGEYEDGVYHEECESVQEDMRPVIERHHQLVIRSGIKDRKMQVKAEFSPLDAPTEAERADSNLKKAQAYKLIFDMGAADGVDINEAVRNDPSFGLSGITPGVRAPGETDVDDSGQPVRTIEDGPAPELAQGDASQGGPDEGGGDLDMSRED